MLGALRLAYLAASLVLCITYSALYAVIPHPLHGITFNTIYSIEISVFLNLLFIQLIPDMHSAIDLRLLFIQRNTQVSNNSNAL